MALPGVTSSVDYCPYDVVEISELLPGSLEAVDSPYGLLWCYLSGERGNGGTVFLHGVHDDMDGWSPLVQAALARGVDLGSVLFVDLPGFGRSPNHIGRLDLGELGDAVLGVAQRLLGDVPIRVVGHSMGTLVAADLAVRRPDRVRSLHLAAGPCYSIVDTVNGRWTGSLSGPLAGALVASQYVLALAGAVGVLGLRILKRWGLLPLLLFPFVAHPRRLRPTVTAHLVDAMRPASFRAAAPIGFRYPDGMSWSKIDCPVAAVFGHGDRLVPRRDAVRLGLDVNQAGVTVLAEAGHLVHIEQPAAVLDALSLS